MTTIDHTQLRKICDRIIKKLASYQEITLADADYYWSINAPECYKMTTDNHKIIVGSLVDDIEELKKLIDNEERPVTFVDLDRLASVFHAISEGMNPCEEPKIE